MSDPITATVLTSIWTRKEKKQHAVVLALLPPHDRARVRLDLIGLRVTAIERGEAHEVLAQWPQWGRDGKVNLLLRCVGDASLLEPSATVRLTQL